MRRRCGRAFAVPRVTFLGDLGCVGRTLLLLYVHMFDLLECAVSDLDTVARTLEPGTLDGPTAKRVVIAAAEIERRACVIKALAAKRLDDTNHWKHSGARSPEKFIADTTGGTVAEAAATVALGAQLDTLVGLNDAARSGKLSPAAAKLIGDAASADPDAEADLLDAAKGGLSKLREECAKVKAAAAGSDKQAKLRAERNFRTPVDDGGIKLEGHGDMASGARFAKILDGFTEKEFELGRREGRRDTYAAYRYDALMRMAEYAHRYATGDHASDSTGHDRGPDLLKFTGLSTQLILIANAQAWANSTPGTTVEIVGFGPVDLATARSMVGDAFIDLVITNGIDATTLAHTSRKATRAQLVALLAGRYECNVDGCHTTTRLQIDHVGHNGWAATKRTAIGDLAFKCDHHHNLKSHKGWRDGPIDTNGKRTLIPPAQANAPPDAEAA